MTVRQQDTLKSVATALDVMECFSLDMELGVSDIARRLGIAKSTAHRLLSTLCAKGFMEQSPDSGRYRLGLHLYELGQLAQSRMRLRQVALPLLEELRQGTGLTVHLGVVDGGDIVYAERLDGPNCLRLMHAQPRRWPAHCTSSGKVIAAFDEDLAERRRALGFPARTVGTVRSRTAYDAMLDETRRRGYGVNRGEAVSGISSVAAPVKQLGGKAIAAVSVVGPSQVLAQDLPRIAQMVTHVAGRVTKQAALAR